MEAEGKPSEKTKKSRVEEWQKENREALHILPGDISGTGDLLKVARTEARKKYGWESVRMLEWIGRPPDGCYVVLVEPKSPPDDVVGELAEDAGVQSDDGLPEVQAGDVAGLRQRTGDS